MPAQRFWRRVVTEYAEGAVTFGFSDAQPREPKLEFANGGTQQGTTP